MVLYRASAGATPVVQCGVVQGFSRSDAGGAVWCCASGTWSPDLSGQIRTSTTDAGGAVWCCTRLQQERRRWCSVVLYRASAGATPVVQCGVVQGFSRSDADGAV